MYSNQPFFFALLIWLHIRISFNSASHTTSNGCFVPHLWISLPSPSSGTFSKACGMESESVPNKIFPPKIFSQSLFHPNLFPPKKSVPALFFQFPSNLQASCHNFRSQGFSLETPTIPRRCTISWQQLRTVSENLRLRTPGKRTGRFECSS